MDRHVCLHSTKFFKSLTVDVVHISATTFAVPLFIGSPQKASLLSAHLSHSILNALTSQHPLNYSPQVYAGKLRLPLRDSGLKQWTQLWSNYSPPCSYLNSFASSCQQGAVIESFLFGCLQTRSNSVVLLNSGEHMLQ